MDKKNRVGSIRAEPPKQARGPWRAPNRALPAWIERAFIAHESSTRAESHDVETVDIGLEIHD